MTRILEKVEQRVLVPLLDLLLAFIWCVFLGSGIGVRRKIHLSFDFLPGILGGGRRSSSAC